MKEVAYKGDGKVAIQNEIMLLRRLTNQRHRNVNLPQLYGVYETQNSLYLAMEYIEGPTLDVYLTQKQTLPVQSRKQLLKGLLNGLKGLAEHQIIHRDLKPENIIVPKDNLQNLKIVDFGLATRINEPKYVFVRCGTPGFVAPEILAIRDPAQARLRMGADMFSLGVIYYQALYGHTLFRGKDQQEVLRLNRVCQTRCPDTPVAQPGEIELLKSMLVYDLSYRATPDSALRSPFLKDEFKEIFGRRGALRTIENMQNQEGSEPICGFWTNT